MLANIPSKRMRIKYELGSRTPVRSKAQPPQPVAIGHDVVLWSSSLPQVLFISGRNYVVRPAELRQRQLDARATRLLRFEKDELMLVGYDHTQFTATDFTDSQGVILTRYFTSKRRDPYLECTKELISRKRASASGLIVSSGERPNTMQSVSAPASTRSPVRQYDIALIRRLSEETGVGVHVEIAAHIWKLATIVSDVAVLRSPATRPWRICRVRLRTRAGDRRTSAGAVRPRRRDRSHLPSA